MGEHINDQGRFQSDKYPTCPAGKVPLSTRDSLAQDLLWRYAQRRRLIDAEFSADLEQCLRADGYDPENHPLRNRIGELVGEASLLFGPSVGVGEFDSAKGADIVERLLALIEPSSLKIEFLVWLEKQQINRETIGDIRRACFVPWDSEWNAFVRDETAKREKPTRDEQARSSG